MDTCGYCSEEFKDEELRPYGPDFSLVCFECMTSTPEREALAGKNFHTQMDACGSSVVLDGTSAGPQPTKDKLN